MIALIRTFLACFALPPLVALAIAAPEDETRSDLGKREVERPLENALAPELASSAPARVEPGLVPWHADLEAALAAAKSSGKPVLLFQLLGRLDQEFC